MHKQSKKWSGVQYPLKATMIVEKQKEVQFEIDTGASCNVVSKEHLEDIEYNLIKPTQY